MIIVCVLEFCEFAIHVWNGNDLWGSVINRKTSYTRCKRWYFHLKITSEYTSESWANCLLEFIHNLSRVQHESVEENWEKCEVLITKLHFEMFARYEKLWAHTFSVFQYHFKVAWTIRITNSIADADRMMWKLEYIRHKIFPESFSSQLIT